MSTVVAAMNWISTPAINLIMDGRSIQAPTQGITAYRAGDSDGSILIVADIMPLPAGRATEELLATNWAVTLGRVFPAGRRFRDGFIQHVELNTSAEIWRDVDMQARAATMCEFTPATHGDMYMAMIQSFALPRMVPARE